MEKFKSYLVEFDENGTIKDEIYLSNCIIDDKDYQPVIVITYKECIFFYK